MQLPVLVQKVKGDGFRARGTEPFAVSAKGATREEAIAKLRDKIQRRLKGFELVTLEIGAQAATENPWLAMAGIYDPADPLVQEWKVAMAAYRQQVENDPDYP